jgi:uncharacterized protein involved in type VI secretion and phage assembly
MSERFHGKYAAIVVDNADPKALARIRAQVPEVFGQETTGWCLACAPYAGSSVGFAAVPPVGSLVFVEWPGGDTSRTPIWSGATWPDGDGVPGAGPEVCVLETPAGHRIEIQDAGGKEAISITAASGASVLLDSNGLTLEFGQQKVVLGQASISLNDGALEVR